jgi:hypothetical protein
VLGQLSQAASHPCLKVWDFRRFGQVFFVSEVGKFFWLAENRNRMIVERVSFF